MIAGRQKMYKTWTTFYTWAFLLIISSVALNSSTSAQTPEIFYRNNKVSLIVGLSAGGGYDLNARLLAKYMGRHILGNPTIVVQNMPGAGSLTAANFMYSVAPKDGTSVATIGRIALLEPLFSKQNFDGSKFYFLGSTSKDISTCVAWKTSPIKTWNDLLTKPFVASGQAAGSDADAFANMIRNLFGAPIKLVTGYPGTNEQGLSMERCETDGFCGISYSSLKTRYSRWLSDGNINILIQNAIEKHSDLTNVPLITDMTAAVDKLQIIRLIVATQSMARPFFLPPGVPSERAETMRRAFEETMRDVDFLDEARKLDIDVSPLDGPTMQTLMTELYSMPKGIIEGAAAAMASPK